MTAADHANTGVNGMNDQQSWNLRWIPRLSGAIAIIENTPCPPSCSSWDEDSDGCDCGKGRALTWLWATVGADEERGRVPEDHPLRDARLAWLP